MCLSPSVGEAREQQGTAVGRAAVVGGAAWVITSSIDCFKSIGGMMSRKRLDRSRDGRDTNKQQSPSKHLIKLGEGSYI